jgi:hypothetical protein
MFHNLIESSSHRQEIKRRGSFLAFTTATYAFLFAITGVVSIYAYDTHLEDRNYEVVTMLPPVELTSTTPAVSRPEGPRNSGNNQSTIPQRQTSMLSVNHPEVVPRRLNGANKNISYLNMDHSNLATRHWIDFRKRRRQFQELAEYRHHASW